ncbi:MAG: MFS transporter [Ignavibacteriae bacterium]|nr:MFS transporter [Ignavibacteriota bacterium]
MIVKSFGKEYLKISGAGFFLYFSYALSRSPIIPLYAESLGASSQMIGFAVAASTITGIFVKLPAGTVSDIIGRKTVLIIGALFFACTPFLYPVVSSVIILILIRLIHGNATAIFGPTISASISDIADKNSRGIQLGLFSSVQGIGQTLGALLGGFLISYQSFGFTFLTSGFIGLAGLMFVIFIQKCDEKRERRDLLKKFVTGIKEVASNNNIVVTSLTVASQMFVVGAYNAFLPLYAKDIVKIEAWQIGLVFGIQTTTTLLARPLMGRFSDKTGRKPIILTALIFNSILISLLTLVKSFELLLVFGILWGLGTSVISSVAVAFITDLTKQKKFGAAHGTYGTIFDIGEALGPIAAGFLVAVISYNWMFILVSLQLLLMTVLFGKYKIGVINED